MALKTKVKVGHISNLSEARYCAGMGVDMLGFTIGGTQGISLEKFKEINGWVTGPELVLEISSPDQFENATSNYYSNYLEINADWISQLKLDKEIALIVRLNIRSWKEAEPLIEPFKKNIHFLLVENFHFENNELLLQIAKNYPILLEADHLSLSLSKLLEMPISGITLKGTDEVKPGLKEYNELSEVLEKLEVD